MNTGFPKNCYYCGQLIWLQRVGKDWKPFDFPRHGNKKWHLHNCSIQNKF